MVLASLFQLVLSFSGLLLILGLTIVPLDKGDMLDSDSSDDLMLGASGGTNGDRGRQTMNTSRA